MPERTSANAEYNTPIYYLELLAEPSQNSALYGKVSLVLALSYVAASDPKAAHRELRARLLDLALVPGGNGDLLKWAELDSHKRAELAAIAPDILTALKTQGAHLYIQQIIEGSTEWPDITEQVKTAVLHPSPPTPH